MTNIKDSFWLKRPWIWGSSYFVLFLICTAFYGCLDKDFHQSTSVAVAGVSIDHEILREQLESNFNSILKEFNRGLNTHRDLKVAIVDTSSTTLSFNIFYRYISVLQATPSEKWISCLLVIPPKPPADSNWSFGEVPIIINDPSGDFLTMFVLVAKKQRGNYKRVGPIRAMIERTEDDRCKPGMMYGSYNFFGETSELTTNYQRLATDKLSISSDGLLKWLKYGLSKWLYLSAVTITTLGFGDIVPLTNWARLLVAMEALLGVLFAGLFLASLANKYGSDSK